MGLLDQVIGGVLGQVLGGSRGNPPQGGGGSGGALGGAMSPIVQALLMLLLQKGAGGLGDIFGGGQRPAPQDHDAPQHGTRDDGDIGGFGQDRGGGQIGGRDGGFSGGRQDDRPAQREGDFSDLSGMLDGPGGAPASGGPGAGPYANLDHEVPGGQSGLDGLIDRFQRGGLGDVMESWIGHGQNRPVAPNQLADALGPDTVDTLQQRTGLGRDDLLSQLAQALPQVIDGLTPQGRRPNSDEHRNW